MAASYR